MLYHTIPPVYDASSEVLILGSFPSVASREAGFFYGHPQNRFWRVLAALWNEPIPSDTESKRVFLLSHHLAVWDVIASCDITGSSDSSIRDVTPNDLSLLLRQAPIRRIFVNGKTAAACYHRYAEPQTGWPACCLPSTSPANAAWSLARLTEAWAPVRDVPLFDAEKPARH